MNAKFAMLLITVLLSSKIYSQSISLGVEAGVNISNANITPTPSVSTDSKTGLIIGGTIDINLTPKLSIVSGMRYTMKGFKQTFQGTTETAKLDYLEFPALLKVKFPLTEVNPYVVVGPTLGINVSAKDETDDGQTAQTTDIKSDVESVDFGLLFGGGLDFRIATKTNLFFQVAYSLGLSDINKRANSTTTIKNYGIQLTAGAKFNL